jgi:hypothetical protein
MRDFFRKPKSAMLLLALLLAATTPTAWASAAAPEKIQPEIRIEVNHKPVPTPDAKPYIDPLSQRTMVPIRFVSEALGAKVDWNAAAQTVTVTEGKTSFTLTINQNTAVVAGKKVLLDAKPVIKKSRTFVPLRFVSESMGAKVSWNEKERLVSIDVNHADPLTIKTAIELALKNNSDLQSLRLDAKNADLNARLVNAQIRDIPAEAIESLDMAQQKYVTQAKAQMAKKVNELYVKSAERKIELGVQKAYYDLVHAEADYKLKEQGVYRAETQKRVAEAFFQAGVKAKTDVLQAEAALSGAKAALAAAENNVKTARMNLNDMIGADLTKEWSLTPEELHTDDLSLPLDEAVNLAVKQRAEVLQKEEELKVAELNTKLVGKYSALSTYQGKISRNEEEKAKIAIEDAKRSVTIEVTQAYNNLNSAKAALEANEKALEAAKENYRLVNLRYENGLATTLEVIQAAEELSNRENQHQTSVHNYHLAVVTYKNAIGN